ncbi:MAG: hypothetical protein ACOX1S_05435 [Anaerostipes sp.]
MRQVYYGSDGVTKITDPFWDNICKECGHKYWSVGLNNTCPACGCRYSYVSNNQNVGSDDILESFGKIRTRKVDT